MRSEDHTPYIYTAVAIALAILLTYLFVACGRPRVLLPPNVGETVLHVSTDMLTYDSTLDAVTAINTAAGYTLIDFGAGVNVRAVSDSTEGHACGSYNTATQEVIVNLDCKGLPSVTIVHEFGHALGLDHSTSSLSIMWPKTAVGRTLSSAAESLVHELFK